MRKEIYHLQRHCHGSPCTDWLNVESEKSVTYLNYFKSESDLEKVLIAIFGYEKALYAPANPEAFGYVGLLCDDAGARKGYKELNVLDFYSNQYMEGMVPLLFFDISR